MPTRKQLEQQFIQDKAFWGSISGRWRGLAGGLLVGAVLGLGFGIVATIGFSVIADVAIAEMGRATLMGILGMFSGAGMLVGGGLWAAAGTVAGAVASGLIAQKELDHGKSKVLEQEVATHVSLPDKPKPPLVNLKVSGIGAIVTGAAGALLAYNNMLPATAGYALMGQEAGTAMAAAGLTMGMFGAVFGVAFQPWQAIKDYTDGFFEGRVLQGAVLAPQKI